jgi:excinuclease UvrABC nuclease subunit
VESDPKWHAMVQASLQEAHLQAKVYLCPEKPAYLEAFRLSGILPPDLILIDGGRGQFEAARTILGELGVEGVEIASIAKGPDRNAGRESFFLPGKEPFRLPPRDPALSF